jgi:hypothetical protein
MVRAVDTGVVNVSNLDTGKQLFFAHDPKRTQLSLAVQESADKLQTLTNLGSKGEQVPAQEMIRNP